MNPQIRAMQDEARRRSAERLEDLWWMADTGEGLTGAARRLGITTQTLGRFLTRHDRALYARLRRQDWEPLIGHLGQPNQYTKEAS